MLSEHKFASLTVTLWRLLQRYENFKQVASIDDKPLEEVVQGLQVTRTEIEKVLGQLYPEEK